MQGIRRQTKKLRKWTVTSQTPDSGRGDRSQQGCVFNYRGTIENSPNGIIFTDEFLVVRDFNAAAERLTGISTKMAMGKNFATLFPQAGIRLDTVDEEKIYRCNHLGFDMGIRLFFLPHLEGTGTAEGQKNGYVILLHEFYNEPVLATELEQTKFVLEELQEIIENSFDGFLVTDGEGNIQLFNQAYLRSTGIPRESLVNHNMRDLINPVWMKNSVAVLAAEQRQPVSLHHATQNGKDIIVTGTPVFDQDGNVRRIVINCRDMSEVYALREELQKAKKLEQEYFSKLAQVGEDVLDEEQDIVVTNGKMQEIYGLARRLGSFDTTVLITGDSGVGKEIVAQYIHKNSLRSNERMIVVNCGAIPENLLESELFGYTEGAFTGALKSGKAGLFEAAQGGTLFLDEIGEISLSLQVKLLRVLETHTLTRIGSSESIPLNIRIIAATNKDLLEQIRENKFREDLYYRLNVVNIHIPPLVARRDDIVPLAIRFVRRYNKRYGQNKKLTYEVLKELEAYDWPGNIRQLKNIVEHMVIVSDNEYLQRSDLPWRKGDHGEGRLCSGQLPTLLAATEQMERDLLRKAKEEYGSTRRIAEILEIDQSTVARKLKKYEL